jgi:hypothetical protein
MSTASGDGFPSQRTMNLLCISVVFVRLRKTMLPLPSNSVIAPSFAVSPAVFAVGAL